MFDSYIKKKNQEFLEKQEMKRKKSTTSYAGKYSTTSRAVKKRRTPKKALSMNELKCMDTIPSAPACVLVGAVAGIETGATGMVTANIISPGTYTYNRIGNKISVQSLSVKFAFKANAVTITDSGLLRCLVVYDKQTNGAYPTRVELLGNLSFNGGATTTFCSGLNINNSKRFTILRDKVFPIGESNPVVYWKEFIKKPLETIYSTGDEDIGDINTGGIFVVWFYVGCTTAPTVTNAVIRCRYYD